MDLLDEMLEHDRWATRRLLAACRDLPPGAFDAECDAGHGSLRATLAHTILAMDLWSAFLAGVEFRRREGPVTLDVLTGEYFDSLNFAACARRVRDEDRLEGRFIDHYKVEKTNGRTILTVLEHNIEHRAEIRHMMARLDTAEVPEVDNGLRDYFLVAGEPEGTA